jgi:Tfp pilus assembly protein PilV
VDLTTALLAAIGTLASAVAFMYRQQMAHQTEAHKEVLALTGQRYEEMRADRDFWRDRYAEADDTQGKHMVLMSEGIAVVRGIVEQLARERPTLG